MFRKFVNRKNELNFLEEKYREDNFNFIVVYGRRRVGKTELIKQFLKNKPNIYLLADKRGTAYNVEKFKEKISKFLKEPKIELNSFDELFAYLISKVKNKLVVVIDEFSYLIEKDDSIPSVFQLIVDEILKKTKIYLILSGSSISMMEKGVLSYKSPLYGRRTGQFKIESFSIREVRKFFPNYNIKECIEAFSVFGGIPFYLEKIDDTKNIFENIENKIIKKGEILYTEIDFLLREELRDPSSYKAILEAMTSGCSKSVEIANKSKIKAKDLDKYLKVLISLGYVKRLFPVTEKPKSKKTIYRIDDKFFDFWFKFCYPNLSSLEIDEIDKVMNYIEENFNSHVGRAFEDVCLEFIKRKNITDFTKIGKWWGHVREEGKRKSIEIDIITLNEQTKQILFCECKWKEKVNAEKIIKELAEKAEYVDWHNKKRKESFALFAKSFKKKIKKFEGRKVYCFNLRDIEKVHSQKYSLKNN